MNAILGAAPVLTALQEALQFLQECREADGITPITQSSAMQLKAYDVLMAVSRELQHAQLEVRSGLHLGTV